MINTLLNIILMQGYGAYIWGSIGLAIAVLIGNYIFVKHEFKKTQESMRENKL